IDMIDYAELIVLNKYDKRGAEDALRDVRKQWKRNRVAFQVADEDVPVYPTIASQFNDPGVSWMFANLCRLLREKVLGEERGQVHFSGQQSRVTDAASPKSEPDPVLPAARCDFRPNIDTSLKE